jgi:hypothetical protein
MPDNGLQTAPRGLFPDEYEPPYNAHQDHTESANRQSRPVLDNSTEPGRVARGNLTPGSHRTGRTQRGDGIAQ